MQVHGITTCSDNAFKGGIYGIRGAMLTGDTGLIRVECLQLFANGTRSITACVAPPLARPTDASQQR